MARLRQTGRAGSNDLTADQIAQIAEVTMTEQEEYFLANIALNADEWRGVVQLANAG
jgi:hypothetical protein